MEVQYFTFDNTYACDECKERKCEEEFKHGGYFDLEDKDFVCRVCWKDDSDSEDESGVPDWVLEQRAEEVENRYSWDEQECPDSPPPSKCVCEKTPDNDYPCLCDEASDSDDDDSDAETEVFAGLEQDDALGLSYVEPPAPLLTPSNDENILPPPPEYSDEGSEEEQQLIECDFCGKEEDPDEIITGNNGKGCGECRHLCDDEEQAPAYDYPTGCNNPQYISFTEFVQWFKENVEDFSEDTPDEVAVGTDIIQNWMRENNHDSDHLGVYNRNIDIAEHYDDYTEDLCVYCETCNMKDGKDCDPEPIKLTNGRWRCLGCYEDHGTKPTAIILEKREPFENEVWRRQCECSQCSTEFEKITKGESDSDDDVLCDECELKQEQAHCEDHLSPNVLRELNEEAQREDEWLKKRNAKWLKAYGVMDIQIVERRRELKNKIRAFEDKILDKRATQDRPNWLGTKPYRMELVHILQQISYEKDLDECDDCGIRMGEWYDAIQGRYDELFGVAKTQTKKKGVYGDKTALIFEYMGKWEDKMDAHSEREFIEISDWRHTIKKEMLVFDKYIKDKRRKTDPEAIEKWDTFTARVRCRVKSDIHRQYVDV